VNPKASNDGAAAARPSPYKPGECYLTIRRTVRICAPPRNEPAAARRIQSVSLRRHAPAARRAPPRFPLPRPARRYGRSTCAAVVEIRRIDAGGTVRAGPRQWRSSPDRAMGSTYRRSNGIHLPADTMKR